jgi:hypothetical protein
MALGTRARSGPDVCVGGAISPTISATRRRCMECPGGRDVVFGQRSDQRDPSSDCFGAQRLVRMSDPISVPTSAAGTAMNRTARPTSSAPHWVSGSLQNPARKRAVATPPTKPPTRRPVPVCERVLRVSERQGRGVESELHEGRGTLKACPWSLAELPKQRPIASSVRIVRSAVYLPV